MFGFWGLPSSRDFCDARRRARLTPEVAAIHGGVSLKTLKRQVAGRHRPSTCQYRLYLARAGCLMEPNFRYWLPKNAALWTPENVRYGAGATESIPYLHPLVGELRQRLREETPLDS
jgi:hypothetical protein